MRPTVLADAHGLLPRPTALPPRGGAAARLPARPAPHAPTVPTAPTATASVAAWPATSLCILVVVAAALHPALTSVMNLTLLLIAAVVCIAVDARIERPLLALMLPFAAMIVIGAAGGLDGDRYLFLKDAWYFANPAVAIATGYVLFRSGPDVGAGLRALVIAGALIAGLHASVFIRHHDLLLELRTTEIRSLMGQGFNAPVLGLTILVAYLGRWRSGLRLHPAAGGALLVVCAASAALAFSRTILLLALIGLVAAAGGFARRELVRIAVAVPLLAGVLFAAQGLLQLDADTARTSLLGKVVRSVEELTVREQVSLQDIHDNWRGHETARALATYEEGGPLELLFGRGFGTLVDVGLFMDLGGDEPMRQIPILHNGYMYLLVKGGPAAVALFAGMMLWVYLLGRRGGNDPARIAQRPMHRTLQAVVVGLAVSTAFLSGAFNRSDMIPYLLAIGWLVAASTDGRRA